MRTVSGARWMGVLILSVLAGGTAILVTRLVGPDGVLLHPLSARLPLATAGTVAAPLLSGLLGIGWGLLAARRTRGMDLQVRALVLVGISGIWMALVSTLWFAVQGDLMKLLDTGPAARAGVSALSTLLLPSTAVVFGAAAVIAARVRAVTRVVALEGRVQAAHSRGLPTAALVLRRVLHHTLPIILGVLMVEFFALYVGSLSVQTAFTTPSLTAALPPLLPAESLPIVVGAALLGSVALIVTGIALATTGAGPPPSRATVPPTALPSIRFRSTDFLDIRDLRLSAGPAPGPGTLVAGVSLTVSRGQAIAVVGADGDGASPLCLAIAGLLPPGSAVSTGSILCDGTELVGLPERSFRRLRGRRIGFIAAHGDYGLDPDVRIGHQLTRLASGRPTGPRSRAKADARALALALLTGVGIEDAETVRTAYPYQVSAATAQRALLAAALVREPHLLIADNPTKHLDADDAAGFLNVLHTLQRERGFTLILASDRVASVLRCDRVAVMHEGAIVEHASVQELLSAPRHPHSRNLLAADEEPAARIALVPGS